MSIKVITWNRFVFFVFFISKKTTTTHHSCIWWNLTMNQEGHLPVTNVIGNSYLFLLMVSIVLNFIQKNLQPLLTGQDDEISQDIATLFFIKSNIKVRHLISISRESNPWLQHVQHHVELHLKQQCNISFKGPAPVWFWLLSFKHLLQSCISQKHQSRYGCHMQWSPKPSLSLITQGCGATRKSVFEVLYGSRDYHAAALSLAYLSCTVCKHAVAWS